MRNKLTLFIALFTFSLISELNAQALFKGIIVDDADQNKLANATIVLLNAQDSILIDFTRANQEGKFNLSKPKSGKFLLLVSYPKYGEFNQHLDSNSPDDLGEISLTSVTNLIEEVMITGKIPIVIKGDTTEYDAGSFIVTKNAKVEDLLKVLPGITVDSDGKITAQGKTVEKVLVDGEEFFGDDPTLVTRSLRSDMIDKVQVFEKKSEEAERTGVDDGIRQQTINVTLKEDAKKGYFGKAEAAGGTDQNDNYYLGKLALNRFNGYQKIGAFAMTSTTGEVNLNWQDAERFNMSIAETSFTEDGGMMIMVGAGDQFTYWNGRGKPTAFSSGVSLNDAWTENKHKLNLSYKFGKIKNDITEGIISQNNLPAGQINSDNNSQQLSDMDRHRLNTKYDLNIDSLTSLTLSVSAGKDNLDLTHSNTVKTTDVSGRLMNDNARDQSTLNEKNTFTYNTYLTRKMKKAGRSISLRIAGELNEEDGNTFLHSKTNIYQSDSLFSTQLIDQMKDIRSKSNNLRSSIAYTEPITAQLNTSLGYEYSNSTTHSINNSYNKDVNNNYTQFDEEFSNDFDFNTVRNAINFSLRYKLDKVDVNLTNNFRNDDLFQRNNHQDMELNRGFFTYNPSLRMRYNMSRSKSVGASFSRTNQLPTLTQIQPLRQNTDPLNIVIGNEDLSPSMRNNYSLDYNSYEMLKGSFSYISLNIGQTYRSIQQNVLIDPNTGIQTLQYENLEDKVANNVNLMVMRSRDLIKKYQIKGDLSLGANMSQYYNYINGTLNENRNFYYSAALSIRKNTVKNMDFSLAVNPGWRTLNTSLQEQFNSAGFTLSSTASYNIYLPKNFTLYGELSYRYEAATQAFDERFERTLFKPGLSKKFLADESLVLDFYINDLFNQNIGFNRSQVGSMLSQNTYNTISRYYMLKVTWDFTSMKGASN